MVVHLDKGKRYINVTGPTLPCEIVYYAIRLVNKLCCRPSRGGDALSKTSASSRGTASTR